MAQAQLRRKSNNALLCNNIDKRESNAGGRWKNLGPIHFTLAGNTIPGDKGVLEYYYDFALVFADNDPVNTLQNYDTLCLDIARGNHFYYVDMHGNSYPVLCVSEWGETTENPDLPENTELTFKATFKIEGYLPV